PVAQTLLLLVSSFWLGAVHAATPGHGKTIAAAYIVGVRGRPVDALVLGIFVTLSHTSGIVLVAVLASIGSAWLIPHRIEAYLALGTGVLVIGIGVWMLISQRALLRPGGESSTTPADPHPHDHAHSHDDHEHAHVHDDPKTTLAGHHSHGWGGRHTHRLDAVV